MGAITGIGKDDSYLKWLQAQKNGANSIMFRSQQNPAVDAEKVQTAGVKPTEQTPAPFGAYTIPGVEKIGGVPKHQAISRVSGETGNPNEISEGTYQGKGFGMVRPEGQVSQSGVHRVNDTDYDPLYGHKKYTMWAVA